MSHVEKPNYLIQQIFSPPPPHTRAHQSSKLPWQITLNNVKSVTMEGKVIRTHTNWRCYWERKKSGLSLLFKSLSRFKFRTRQTSSNSQNCFTGTPPRKWNLAWAVLWNTALYSTSDYKTLCSCSLLFWLWKENLKLIKITHYSLWHSQAWPRYAIIMRVSVTDTDKCSGSLADLHTPPKRHTKVECQLIIL